MSWLPDNEFGFSVAERERPDPSPFRLEAPLGVVAGVVCEGCRHRFEGRPLLTGWPQVLPHQRQPLFPTLVRAGEHQMPDAGETLPIESEGEAVRASPHHLVFPVVEDAHFSPAVLVFGDRPGKGGVLHGMIRSADRQMTLTAAPGQAFGDRPGDQNRALLVEHLQAEVVMEGGGVMLLDHEHLADGCRQRVDVRQLWGRIEGRLRFAAVRHAWRLPIGIPLSRRTTTTLTASGTTAG